MVIVGSFELGQIIVLEAALSYLGLDSATLPSWIDDQRGPVLSRDQSMVDRHSGLALFMLVAGVQFLTRRYDAQGRRNATSPFESYDSATRQEAVSDKRPSFRSELVVEVPTGELDALARRVSLTPNPHEVLASSANPVPARA
jgi:hypothetical protein